jgi:hypothetical protein
MTSWADSMSRRGVGSTAPDVNRQCALRSEHAGHMGGRLNIGPLSAAICPFPWQASTQAHHYEGAETSLRYSLARTYRITRPTPPHTTPKNVNTKPMPNPSDGGVTIDAKAPTIIAKAKPKQSVAKLYPIQWTARPSRTTIESS